MVEFSTEFKNNINNSSSGNGAINNTFGEYLMKNSIIFGIFSVILSILGVIANGTIVLTILLIPALRQKKMYVLIANQNFANFVNCFVSVVHNVLRAERLLFSFNSLEQLRIYCYVLESGWLQFSAFYTSVNNIMLISLERYMKIVHPIFYLNHCSYRMLCIIAVASWVIGFGTVIPAATLSLSFVNNVCVDWSFVNDLGGRVTFGLYIFLFIYLLPVVVFGASYTAMIRKLKNRKTKVVAVDRSITMAPGGAVTSQTNDDSKKTTGTTVTLSKSQYSLAKTFSIVTGAFIIFCGPFEISYLVYNLGSRESEMGMAKIVNMYSYFLQFLYVCIEPFIYGFSNKDFRERLHQLLRVFCCGRC